MKVELFPFQQQAVTNLRNHAGHAMEDWARMHVPQVISFTAPTGAGKTIIAAALIESILWGDDYHEAQPDAVFVWLSDSPELNEQSADKIITESDRIKAGQCVMMASDSFDQETLDGGTIYFLNTQKLGKDKKLTSNGDSRDYTLWETLANTVADKGDRLYFIIDEAHRGAKGRPGEATTIMQKFIKGSPEDGLPAMPLVIGMSATIRRFQALIGVTSSASYSVSVSPEQVRASGLLKDRIVITHPEGQETKGDVAVLQAAADDWHSKCEHWTQYLREQHYKMFNPILIIQVANGNKKEKGKEITTTNLSLCLETISKRTGVAFSKGQVVHTFGDTTATLSLNGVDVPYEKPSEISDDANVRVVFFKENLSTGWDCPRAETMLSYRGGEDYTYVAQLVGRMIRTPLRMHIQVDDTLNDVHLYLPYFDQDTVSQVVDELTRSEGGDLPVDVEVSTPTRGRTSIITVNIDDTEEKDRDDDLLSPANATNQPEGAAAVSPAPNQTTTPNHGGPSHGAEVDTPRTDQRPAATPSGSTGPGTPMPGKTAPDHTPIQPAALTERPQRKHRDTIHRPDIVRFVNDSAIPSYRVRRLKINDYLKSLLKMAHFLTQTPAVSQGPDGISHNYSEAVHSQIADRIHEYIQTLHDQGRYDKLADHVRRFKLATETFETYGGRTEGSHPETVTNLFVSTDIDIDRQFDQAEHHLYDDGVGISYGIKYGDPEDPTIHEVDVILFTNDEEQMNMLQDWARDRFHEYEDKFHRYVALVQDDAIRRDWDCIVSDGDAISRHNLRLPESIRITDEPAGEEYGDHLYVNPATLKVQMKLNGWEAGVIAEEEKRPGFVCWLRNPSGAPWALCLPYELNGETKATYPDFIIVRRNPDAGDDLRTRYVLDILEPHNPSFKDNLAKAQAFARYARQAPPQIGRIQLIRQSKDPSGKLRFRRLDMSKSAIRDKVLKAMTLEELDHIVDTDGEYQD